MSLTPGMRAFLDEIRFAVLATSFPDGRIHQTVMWYERRDDQIIMNTARGRIKDTNIRRNPAVSLCWEDGYHYLTISGTVSEIIDDQDIAQADILSIARRYHPGVSDDDIHRRFANFRREQRVTLVVSIDKVVSNFD